MKGKNTQKHKENTLKILTTSDLEKKAPSIFTNTSIVTASDKYKHIPTFDTIEALEREGFYPVFAQESRVRLPQKVGHSRHMIRFRKDGLKEVNGLLPEIVLVNSHDCSTSYQLRGGIYRLVCSNGMIIGSDIFNYKIRHQGNPVDKILEASDNLLNKFPKCLEIANKWEEIEVSPGVQLQFAKRASEMRWSENIILNVEDLLNSRRIEDKKNDLWTTFNRVQENLVRGGIACALIDDSNKRRKNKTREIKSVSELERVNVGLWNLAEELSRELV